MSVNNRGQACFGVLVYSCLFSAVPCGSAEFLWPELFTIVGGCKSDHASTSHRWVTSLSIHFA